MTRTCFAQDEFGCCGGTTTTGSVCEPCPAGQVEESACRVSGCEACEDICRPPLEEAGCCGSSRRAVGNASAGCVCPEGTVPDAMCDAVFPACGCGPEFEPMADPPARDPLPPVDAGARDAGARSDGGTGGAPQAPDSGPPFVEMCHPDLGGGCCGASVIPVEACGCRIGQIRTSECTGESLMNCYADLGSGCCGARVAACDMFECPAGSLSAPDCEVLSPDVGGEAPMMIAECAMDLEGACCGDAVEANACGSCPTGSVPMDTCNPAECPSM